MTMHDNLPFLTGRKRKVEDGEQLREYFMDFIKYNFENPMARPTVTNGKQLDVMVVPPLTLTGFQLFLDVGETTWREWRESRDDLKETISKIEAAIRDQKLKGASIGVFNANIIARELGLADRQTIDITPAELPDPVDAQSVADRVHPDDPLDEDGEPTGLLYTAAQLEAGMPFIPKKSAC